MDCIHIGKSYIEDTKDGNVKLCAHVTVNGTELSNTSEGEDPKPMCYIVSTDASVTVEETSKGELKKGELYFVRK